MAMTQDPARHNRHPTRPAPILVTGMPRSGTTWLARQLASTKGSALTGREPMNPRGRQFALGGTLPRWQRVETFTPRQSRILRTSYRGWHPLVYSRYGHRQWAAPWPWTRLVVKDPFAVLSLPAVVAETGALPVVAYRHPGAVLHSYRRMGWTAHADTRDFSRTDGSTADEADAWDRLSQDAVEVLRVWLSVYSQVLADAADLPRLLVVSHEELATGGHQAIGLLATECGVRPAGPVRARIEDEDASRLHNLHRDPSSAATAWRSRVDSLELSAIEDLCSPTMTALQQQRLPLGT